MKPHRGVLILILGIFSLFCCGIILGPIAWIMGNNDLKEMREGRMDREGETLTNVGRILGMIGVILWVVGIVAQIIFMAIGVSFMPTTLPK